jgi:predicted dithiol-disulfide oxidoreductase (DUF899 family)
MATRNIVSRKEWLSARQIHLDKEKEFTRLRDQLSAARRELPMVLVDKDYIFESAGGPESLSGLFAGRSQLILVHFMFGPEWQEGCPSCSYMADNYSGMDVHLNQRDVTLVAASRAPLAKLGAYKARMGWDFKWVSSLGSDFNADYHVSFDAEEMAAGQVYYNYRKTSFPSEEAPGVSAFLKDDDGAVYHTYSSYGRGLDLLIGTYNFLDLAPKGRDEGDLPYPMAWIKRHDQY